MFTELQHMPSTGPDTHCSNFPALMELSTIFKLVLITVFKGRREKALQLLVPTLLLLLLSRISHVRLCATP